MRMIWSKEAMERLLDIEEFIARDSPTRAEKFINCLIKRGELILENHYIGRVVPEIANPEIREMIIKKYRLVYKIKKDTIEILSVFECHRLLRLDELNID